MESSDAEPGPHSHPHVAPLPVGQPEPYAPAYASGQGSDIFRSQNSHVTDGALNHSLNGSDLPVFIAALDER